MTPTEMAALHQACFTVPRPWSVAEFALLLDDPLVMAVTADSGFLLGRIVAGEAEVLTLAVDPDARRRGVGRGLMARFHQVAHDQGATEAFLEVADDNSAARALYAELGYRLSGTRRGYYRQSGATAVDALVMRSNLAGQSTLPPDL